MKEFNCSNCNAGAHIIVRDGKASCHNCGADVSQDYKDWLNNLGVI